MEPPAAPLSPERHLTTPPGRRLERYQDSLTDQIRAKQCARRRPPAGWRQRWRPVVQGDARFAPAWRAAMKQPVASDQFLPRRCRTYLQHSDIKGKMASAEGPVEVCAKIAIAASSSGRPAVGLLPRTCIWRAKSSQGRRRVFGYFGVTPNACS